MNEVCPKYHVPVMLMQSVDAMNIGNGNYVDVTFGGGGHTRAAGCDLHGSMYDVINNITAEIERQLAEEEDA